MTRTSFYKRIYGPWVTTNAFIRVEYMGCVLSTQPDQQIKPQCKNAQKVQKILNIETFFLAHFAHSAFYKIHISGAANRHAPVQYAKYVFFFFFFSFCFFLSSHHNTNPLLHLYHFYVKNISIYWLILTVNHLGSCFYFFVFIQWVKHFCTPANFVTI